MIDKLNMGLIYKLVPYIFGLFILFVMLLAIIELFQFIGIVIAVSLLIIIVGLSFTTIETNNYIRMKLKSNYDSFQYFKNKLMIFATFLLIVSIGWIYWHTPYAKLIIVNGCQENKNLIIGDEVVNIEANSYTFKTIYSKSFLITIKKQKYRFSAPGKYIVNLTDKRKVAYMKRYDLIGKNMVLDKTGIPGVKVPHRVTDIERLLINSRNNNILKEKVDFLLKPSGKGVFYLGMLDNTNKHDHFDFRDYTESRILIQDTMTVKSHEMVCSYPLYIEEALQDNIDPLSQIGIKKYCNYTNDENIDLPVYIDWSYESRDVLLLRDIEGDKSQEYIAKRSILNLPQPIKFIPEQKNIFDFDTNNPWQI